MGPVCGALWGCVHTPPHDAVPGAAARRFAAVEDEGNDGHRCRVEVESLWWVAGAPTDGSAMGDKALWTEELPEGEGWCTDAGERATMVDIVALDGPFLSTRESTFACCPEVRTLRCVTRDVRTDTVATLEMYDSKHARKRWEQAERLAAALPAGFVLDPQQFLIGGGHVVFCAIDGDEMMPIPVK